jgi:Mrp family chromosome partitioning ATPase
VVLVDADLRRAGVSRLLGQQIRFTLRDFLAGCCTAEDVIAVEERSGVRFVPSTPVDAPWTSHDLRRFAELIDHLKARYALIIIDMPPILGLAETIRLTVAADSIALIIRWGRTERRLVQYALESLRTAGAFASAVILNDVNLKAQQRRGYHDRTIVYTDDDLYRAGSQDQEPLSTASPRGVADVPRTSVETDALHAQPVAREPNRPEAGDDPVPASTAARSDIERLYSRQRR